MKEKVFQYRDSRRVAIMVVIVFDFLDPKMGFTFDCSVRWVKVSGTVFCTLRIYSLFTVK